MGGLIRHGVVVLALAPGPALAGEVAYLSPSAVVADRTATTLYVAECTASQVAAVDLATGHVKRKYPLPQPPGGLAISPDGARLYVTGAAPAGKVYVIDLGAGSVLNEIAVGHTPVSPVASSDSRFLYVCNRFSNTVSVIDLKSGKQDSVIRVLREPVDAALSPDGMRLVVANLLPVGPANVDYVSARVSIIDTARRKVLWHVALPTGSTNVQGLCLSPDGRYAYAVHIRGHYRLATIQLDRGWMNVNVLSVIDVARRSLVKTVVLDDSHRGAANPWDVACTEDGRHLVVTHAGTHEVSVIDRVALHEKLAASQGIYQNPEAVSPWQTALMPPDFSFLRGLRRRVKLAGAGPRGLAVAGTKVDAAEYFSDSVGVVDIGPDADQDARSVALGPEQRLTPARRGEMLFHEASDCFEQWQSCATCHAGEGRVDGLNWDLLNDGLDNPKSTKSMLLAHETPPAMTTGVRDRAETAVRAGMKYILFAERPEADAAAIDDYLKALKPVPSPHLANGTLSDAARRGLEVFRKAQCDSCHPAPRFTNMRKFDVGTATHRDSQREFDTPTLVEVWRTAPYLHNGRAATIREVLTTANPNDAHGVTSELTEQEIEDLAEYVLSL